MKLDKIIEENLEILHRVATMQISSVPTCSRDLDGPDRLKTTNEFQELADRLKASQEFWKSMVGNFSVHITLSIFP